MNIGILGSGNIGGTIGKKWAASGHEIVFGVRDPEAMKVRDLLDRMEGSVSAASLTEAVGSSDVVLFAVPGKIVPGIAASLGELIDGKILIDATNQMGADVMNSLEILKKSGPHSHLYRAFNNLGWENFEEPAIHGIQIDLFYCGEAGEEQTIVDDLIRDVGLNPVYVGGLDQVEIIDNLTQLWFGLALRRGFGRRLAFKMIRE